MIELYDMGCGKGIFLKKCLNSGLIAHLVGIDTK